jgi:hypothetical protein
MTGNSIQKYTACPNSNQFMLFPNPTSRTTERLLVSPEAAQVRNTILASQLLHAWLIFDPEDGGDKSRTHGAISLKTTT